MNKIKFNNAEFEVESYNKTTSFMGETMSSTAYCTIITDDIEALNEVAQTEITTIQISHDDEVIYSLENQHGHIDSTNEYLNGDRMSVSANLSFTYE